MSNTIYSAGFLAKYNIIIQRTTLRHGIVRLRTGVGSRTGGVHWVKGGCRTNLVT